MLMLCDRTSPSNPSMAAVDHFLSPGSRGSASSEFAPFRWGNVTGAKMLRMLLVKKGLTVPHPSLSRAETEPTQV